VTEQGDSSRKDAGKDAGFHLIPRRPLAKVATVYQIGADKYSPRGWEAGMAWSRVADPLDRHWGKWLSGETYDQTDGQHHLASVVWAGLTLMEYEETHPELDDLARELIAPRRLIVATRDPQRLPENINRPELGNNAGNPDAPEACDPPECKTAGPAGPLWTQPGMGYTDQRGR
jgi:hypothetical protein